MTEDRLKPYEGMYFCRNCEHPAFFSELMNRGRCPVCRHLRWESHIDHDMKDIWAKINLWISERADKYVYVTI